jgi:hypothetical protein
LSSPDLNASKLGPLTKKKFLPTFLYPKIPANFAEAKKEANCPLN